ncbi:MAG TPA: TMEM165/GDT1 family protein [Nocardioidaceae bacterium]|nr:TMEM165/GDT1 family protein [Nocardioidaceae bacterium]
MVIAIDLDPAVVAQTFGLILPVELPDKTFVAALVLAARYRPWPVWLGVGAAFFVQTVVAVTAGHFATLLPQWALLTITMAIFSIGAIVLVRTASGAAEEEREQETEYAGRADVARTGWRAAGASFLVLFAAEWGDLSQLLTISQVARTGETVSVFIGAWAALLVISGLAVFVGRVLLRYLRLSVLHYIGASVCALFAVLSLVELIRL